MDREQGGHFGTEAQIIALLEGVVREKSDIFSIERTSKLYLTFALTELQLGHREEREKGENNV